MIIYLSIQINTRVISLIENWEDKSLLSALKNIDISSKWMKEYLMHVFLTHHKWKGCKGLIELFRG